MTEERSRLNKYVHCFCSKHSEVLVGTEAYKYLNIFCVSGGIGITLLALVANIDVLSKLIAIVLFGIPATAVLPLNYGGAKKAMLRAGHTEKCSRKIARMVTLRASLWGDKFKIMKDEDNKDHGKTSTVK